MKKEGRGKEGRISHEMDSKSLGGTRMAPPHELIYSKNIGKFKNINKKMLTFLQMNIYLFSNPVPLPYSN